MPAPTTQTSAWASSVSGGCGGTGAVAIHTEVLAPESACIAVPPLSGRTRRLGAVPISIGPMGPPVPPLGTGVLGRRPQREARAVGVIRQSTPVPGNERGEGPMAVG